jgi:uncharacterized protein (TIGR04255 family)
VVSTWANPHASNRPAKNLDEYSCIARWGSQITRCEAEASTRLSKLRGSHSFERAAYERFTLTLSGRARPTSYRVLMNGSLLNVPHVPRRRFKRHFLNSVHCELGMTGFQAEKIVASRTPLAGSLSALGFTHAQEIQQGSLVFQSSGGAPTVQQAANISGLTFLSENPLRQLNVTGQGLLLSDFGYEGFDAFSSRLAQAAAAVVSVLGEFPVLKIGLRKINAIRMDSVRNLGEACTVFNRALFGAVRSAAIDADTLKASQEVIHVERDTGTFVLRTNLAPTGIPDSFQAYLDFDFITQKQCDLGTALNRELPSMNQFHFDVFMWAVTSDFLTLLEK